MFENIFDNCFVIIGNGEFNHTGIKCRGGQNDANPDFHESKLKRKNSKLNGNPNNIILFITALSTLKNLTNI